MTEPKLTIELVPSTSWGSNLRSELKRADWDKLRKEQYAIAEYKCEICGGKGEQHPVECHEIWVFGDGRILTQKLVGLIALCPACHAVKHYGRTQMEGREQEALAHLMKVNGWTKDQAVKYVMLAMAVWEERSEQNWTLDISWLKTSGRL